MVLEVKNLCKSFGHLSVIENLSINVEENSVFGFIGKNGAGKTTTMKMILGFLKADKGEIYVCGEKVEFGNNKTNKYIGYLPDVPEYYGYMTPKEYLKLCGEICGMNKNKISKKSDELLKLVGLENNKNRRIKGFSRGMKQRLGIAQALLNEPKLLICDEPTSALDPVGRKDILDILLKVKNRTTIIFSTHILSDVERICDNIGVLNNGKLALYGSLSEIKNKNIRNSIALEVVDEKLVNKAKEVIESSKLGYDIKSEEKNIKFNVTNVEIDGNKILKLIVNEGIRISKFEILEPSLENIFLEVIE